MSRITKKIGLNKWVLGLWVVNFELGYMKANVVLLFKFTCVGLIGLRMILVGEINIRNGWYVSLDWLVEVEPCKWRIGVFWR